MINEKSLSKYSFLGSIIIWLKPQTFIFLLLALTFFSCTSSRNYEEISASSSKLERKANQTNVTKSDVDEAWMLANEAKNFVKMLKQAKDQEQSVGQAEIDKAKRLSVRLHKLAQKMQSKFDRQNRRDGTPINKINRSFKDVGKQGPFGIALNNLPANFDSKYLKKMRIQQVQLCKITSDFNKKMEINFSQNKNLGIDNYKDQFAKDVDGLLPFGRIDDWIVKIVDLEKRDNNKVRIHFTLQCPASFIGEINSNDMFLKQLKIGNIALVSGKVEAPPVLHKSSSGPMILKNFFFSFQTKFNLSKN